MEPVVLPCHYDFKEPSQIDLYAQELLRYLISGTHTKSRYNVRYDDLKAMGYKSLVNEYYRHNKEQ